MTSDAEKWLATGRNEVTMRSDSERVQAKLLCGVLMNE